MLMHCDANMNDFNHLLRYDTLTRGPMAMRIFTSEKFDNFAARQKSLHQKEKIK